MEQAAKADEALARGITPGPLYGLPIAIKDLVETKGIRAGLDVYNDQPADKDCAWKPAIIRRSSRRYRAANAPGMADQRASRPSGSADSAWAL